MTNTQSAVTYRPAQASDEAAIKALIRAVNINPIGLKWQRFMVAVDENGRLIGCGQIKPHRDGPASFGRGNAAPLAHLHEQAGAFL